MDNRKLLIVVDMQRDFVDGALGSAEAAAVVKKIADKVNDTEKVVFTFDTHEDNYMETQEGRNLPIPHCIRGTDGHRLVPELEIFKDRCYTAEKKTFGSVQLGLFVAEMFEKDFIDEVELVGVCTDVCVISNAMIIKAFCPEIPIKVDASCCAGVTVENHTNALKAMQACQIEILNMEETV